MGVLADAELLLQAKNYSGSGAWLDESGNGHDGQLGSTSGSDTNDPLFLEPDGGVGGTQYFWNPGSAGNYASSPDHARLDIVGDLDIRIKLAMDDWTPSGFAPIGPSKWQSAGQLSWNLYVRNTTGKLNLFWSEDGSATRNLQSTVGTGFTNGTVHWVRAVLDVDGGAAGVAQVTYYTSEDGVAWTPLGTAVDDTGGSAPSSIFSSTSQIEIGASSAGVTAGQPGKYHRAQVYNSAGTLVFDADFTDRTRLKEPFATFTEKANDAVVTINRAATGVPATVVDRPMLVFDGVDDYITVADHADLDFALTDSFTVMVAGRTPDITPAADDVLYSKQTNLTTGAGYSLYLDTGGTFNGVVADGTNSTEDVSAAGTNNVAWVAAMVRNVVDDDLEAFKDGTGSGSPTTDATTGTSANALPVRIGAIADTAANFYTGQITAVAVWRSALTDAEVLNAGREMTGDLPPNMLMLGVG